MRWQAPDDFSKHLRRASTPAECLLWQLVRNRQPCQAKFQRQHKLGPYLLDFYCPEAKLAVECDGLPHFTPQGIEKDRVRTQWLNRQGVEVIRFTSNEIENDTQRVLLEIDVVLKRLLIQDTPPHPPTPSPPEEDRGGEGELDHQPLCDFAIAIALSRCLEQKLREQKLLQYRIFNTPCLACES